MESACFRERGLVNVFPGHDTITCAKLIELFRHCSQDSSIFQQKVSRGDSMWRPSMVRGLYGLFHQAAGRARGGPACPSIERAGLMRVEAEYCLSEHAFNQASDAPTKFLRAHVGAVPPMVQMSHAKTQRLRIAEPAKPLNLRDSVIGPAQRAAVILGSARRCAAGRRRD